jgi:metallophosphoesterase (TIGR00282 family)
MIGDVVGEPGLKILEDRLPGLIKEYSADFITVNGENAANGFGLTVPFLERIFAAGASVVSSGNHIWEQRDFWPTLDSEPRMLRPLNYPDAAGGSPGTPGKGWVMLEKTAANGETVQWFTVNLQGREFMNPIDCPFKAFDALEAGFGAESKNSSQLKPVILVDFHAESTREKEALGFHLDGRVSVFAGTHTHVQTADERILPKGTAYITDLGMTGFQNGVIGMDPKICVDRARNQVLYRLEVASADTETAFANASSSASASALAVQGIIAEINAETGKAISIKRL